jgi:hypothetical protein
MGVGTIQIAIRINESLIVHISLRACMYLSFNVSHTNTQLNNVRENGPNLMNMKTIPIVLVVTPHNDQ